MERATFETQKSQTPEEELAYLRERVREKERELGNEGDSFERNRIARREVARYGQEKPADVLHETTIIPEHDAMRAALDLEPESHDAQIDKLLTLVSERGIRNALSVLAKSKNPHLEDDFHRALVRYVDEGFPVGKSHARKEMWRALNTVLFEVHPHTHAKPGEERQPLEQALASMEQLYAGLLSMVEAGGVFSLEIALPEGAEDVVLYIAVPKEKRTLFEQQVFAVFPDARIEEARGDYNIFAYEGEAAGAVAEFDRHHSLPIRTYKHFEHDPLNVLLSAFGKLQKHNEGATLQIVVGNEKDTYNTYYRKILRQLNKGESFKKAIKTPRTAFGEVASEIGGALFVSSKSTDENNKEKIADSQAIEMLTEKTESRIVPVTIRAVASAKDARRAEEALSHLTAAFHQFSLEGGNSISFRPLRRGALDTFLRAFSFRLPDRTYKLPLNLSELTSLFHLGVEGVSTSQELRRAHAKEAPAPGTMPEEGITLGTNRYAGKEREVRFGREDRMRHFYCIGQTGTGKTTLMKNMILQDIQNGDGVCYIDPHGRDIEDILAAIPPEREDDLVYFNPTYSERVMGLNILEYDPARPEMKTLVVDELYEIFRKLYSDVPEAFGPMFEQYYRNATMLAIDDPESGGTLTEISRVLSDAEFRQRKLERCSNPLVVQFWEKIAQQAGGEASLENIVPYITSKFDAFLANDIMRPIVAQERSAFNFRTLMDERKIFLANLSKGHIGERNADLLGLIMVGKFLQAALSRADTREEQPPFYLYIDEFQNFTTPTISTIFSEARKYNLSLNVAHQFIAQLSDPIRDAVFGNVGTRCAFRVGNEDAEVLAKTFAPTFEAGDLEKLENHHAYISLLVNGEPVQPFSLETIAPQKYDTARVDELAQRSYDRYGRLRSEVEAEISEKFKNL